jgi:uncharacterized SAM-binding protein YcdF (DUF218 family)
LFNPSFPRVANRLLPACFKDNSVMTISWLLTNAIAAFLLPPTIFLLLILLGFLLHKRRRVVARALIAFSLAALWLLSTPLVARHFLDSLPPPYVNLNGLEAEAIVILGGGSIKNSLEYDGDTLSRFSLERVRYGAWLAKKFNKPVLVTGGAPDGGVPEAALMRSVLVDEFAVKNVRWVESQSRNTRENARFSAPLLQEAGIKRIYLVSNAWHLARAIPEFTALGLQVVPAGTGYKQPKIKPLDFLPSGSGLRDSWLAGHEWIGLLWYRIRT